VFTSYLDGNLVLDIKSEVESELRDELAGLQPEEAAVLALLRARLKQTVDDGFLNGFAPLLDREREADVA
jgi:DNA topoisomerase I